MAKRGFVIHHNGPPAKCVGQPHAHCVSFWAAVKAYHQAKWPNSNDIAYSFGCCPHGVRFVGRGWDKNQYANGSDDVGPDDGGNSEWFSVLVFVGGGYTEDGKWVPEEKPTPEMVQATTDLIGEGRSSGRCGQRVLPHSAFKVKPCPGPTFTAYAEAWDNQPLPGGGPAAPAPDLEVPDMYVIDCAGKPALVLGLGGVQQLTPAQRGVLRSLGVEAHLVDVAAWDALWSLRAKAVDVEALATALVAKLPAGSVDVAAIVSEFRQVLATVEVESTGHLVLADS